MTAVNDLLTDVRAALPAAVGVNFTATTDPWYIYQAWVFAQVVVAAGADHYSINYCGLSGGGAVPREFVFRRGPGSIWSPNFSYVRLTHADSNAPALELHVGVGVEGQSGVAHEADVSAINETEARQARQQQFAPRVRSCIFVFECKYYLSRLKLSILREYLGLTTDLRSQGVRQWLVSNVTHPELPMIMKRHKREWADDALPNSTGVRRLLQQIEPALHRYRR